MRTPDATSPVHEARAAGGRFVDTKLFEVLSRAGFIARGLVYAIIGILAFDLATGHGGKITNQQGALKTVEHQPFGHFLLALLAVGLGGYASWRLFRAALGHGPEGADRGIERLGALGSGIVYAAICALAVSCSSARARAAPRATRSRRRAASSPGRQVAGSCCVAGIVMLGVAGYQFFRGVGEEVPRRRQDREDGPRHEDLDHLGGHGRPRRPRGRVRARRSVPRQGRGRLQGERGDRPRRRAREGLRRATAPGCWGQSPPVSSSSGSSRSPRRGTAESSAPFAYPGGGRSLQG